MQERLTSVRKALKILGKVLLVLLGLFTLLVLLIRLPIVQNQIVGFAGRYLHDKTGADIQIGKVYIDYLGHILVEEVLVPDPTQDTLLHLGKLEAGFQLRSLLRKKVILKKLELEDVLVDAHPLAGGSMNYQYLLDAFAGDPSVEESAPSKPKSSGPGWDIRLPHAAIGLHRIDLRYRTPDSSLVANGYIGGLDLRTDQVSLLQGKIGLDRIALEDSELCLGMFGKGEPEEEDEPSAAPLHYAIEVGELAINNVRYRMDMEDLLLDTYVGDALAVETEVGLLGDTIRIGMDQFDLGGSTCKMDIPSAAPVRGFDYNHMDLDGITIRFSDLDYTDLGMRGQVRELAARDRSGFALTGFRALVHYSPDSVAIHDLIATTPRSRIDMSTGRITTPFLEDSTRLEDSALDLIVENTTLVLSDIACFVPALYDLEAYPAEKDQPWRLDTRIRGSLADLDIADFRLAGRSTRAHLSGRVQHAMDMGRLATDLTIHNLQSSGPYVQRWLPPGTLPGYIELPEVIALQGNVQGPVQDLKLDLNTSISRYVQPVTANLKLQGALWDVLDTEKLRFDMALDTFWASRTEMQAYLPDSFPAYIRLPDAVGLRGRLRGTLDTAFVNLELDAWRNSRVSTLALSGRVDSLTHTDALAFDLQLKKMSIQPEELAAYLPQDALPDYLRLPRIRSAGGAFEGNMQNLGGQVDIATSAGFLHADAHLLDSVYTAEVEIDSLVLQKLFTDSIAYDSVVPWPAPPIALHVEADGKGLDIERDLLADARLQLRLLGDTLRWEEGLVLAGKVDRKSFRGTLKVDEQEAGLDLNILADFNAGADTTALAGEIGKLDLHRLNLLEIPFALQTELTVTTRGKRLDSLFALATMENFRIQYDSVTEASQVIQMELERIKAENKINVILVSDFLTAALVDQGDHPEYVARIIPELADRLNLAEQQLQLNPDPTRNLALDLKVIRPDIFTSGLIPGLTELDTIHVLGVADQRDSSYALHANIPHVKYLAYEIDSTVIGIVNWDELFGGGLKVTQARLFDEIQVRDLSLFGVQSTRDTIEFTLQQTDTILSPSRQQSLRFLVEAQLIRNNGSYQVRFLGDPVLNYDTLWRFDPRNKLVYSKDQLKVNDLKLYRSGQSLSIDEVGEDQIEIAFRNFGLGVISDIVKWESNYLAGTAEGQVRVKDPLKKPRIQVDLLIGQLGIRNASLGDLRIRASGDEYGLWEGDIGLRGEGNQVALKGSYSPDADTPVEATLETRPFDLATIKPMLTGQVEALKGKLQTDLRLSGSPESLHFQGFAGLEQVLVTPTLTQSPLRIDDGRIQFRDQVISSPEDMVIRDSLGNEARLALGIVLEDLSNPLVDARLDGKGFLLLNTPPNDSALYYGSLISDFNVRLSGNLLDVILVNAFLSPKKGSQLTYVYDQSDVLGEIETGEGLVEFVDFEPGKTPAPGELFPDSTQRESGFKLDLAASLVEEVGLTVLMDRRTEDRLEGKAKGDLALTYFPNGDMELTGQLDVSGSEYYFTFQDVIKKQFELLDGSRLVFTGPVANPSLNLKAGYRLKSPADLLVSTYGDIDPEEEAEKLNPLRRRQEFLVDIRAEGTLEEAELSADITYPQVPGNSSPDLVGTALDNLREDPNEMNAQAFSLILFNGFRLSGGGGQSGLNVQQEVGNLLSSQLNNLANRYVNFVELDFGIETLSGGGAFDPNDTDFRIGLKKRFFNDRLTVEVDGVAGGGSDNDQSTGMQSFLENISLDYALNKNHTLRIRAFNEYVDDDFIAGNVNEIGGALLISKDFDRLFFKKNFRQPVQPDTSRMLPADSLHHKN